MKNEYDQIIADAVAQCALHDQDTSYAQCCKQAGKDCSTSFLESLNHRSTSEGVDYFGLSIALAFALFLLAFLSFAVRKRWLSKCWNKASETIKATITGWLIWIAAVGCYVLLKEPYGNQLYKEDVHDLLLWFVLPPLCVLATVLWVRRFVRDRK